MTSKENNTLFFKRFVVGPIETNCYVVYDPNTKKGGLIDPGEYSQEVAEYIEKEELEVLWIINTHGHPDHVSGDAGFGYPVMIHPLDEPLLSDPERNSLSLSTDPLKPVLAERLLEDGATVPLGNFDLEVIHTPGHTPGSISIKCGNLLFSGDTLFFEGVGRTDLPGGDPDLLKVSIREKLMVLDDPVRVFPGHGPETTIGHERKNNPYL